MVIHSFNRRRSSLSCRILSVVISLTFIFSFITPPGAVFAQGSVSTPLNLPAPGSMVSLSQNYTPLYIKGITIDPQDPLKFSFIVNSGDTDLKGGALKAESEKLIKYFMAALTVPEEELWVNLSPYDRANIIPENFGYTEMGRDLLAQDYILKQIAASGMYPDSKTGSTFWNQVQQKIKETFGAADVPVNMFNKIWIVPDKAEVYEINGSAYVVDSHLKVMLEEDYFALKNDDLKSDANDAQAVSKVSSQVVRDVLLPEIEKEVNEGKNFANLRQIYNANILATWYKMNLRDSLLGQVYIDKNKVSGVDVKDKSDKLKIYEQYVAAFKKGAYEMVKRDYDPATQQVISKKYFAGGATFVDTPRILVQDFKQVSSPLQLSAAEQIKLFKNVASSPAGTEDFRVNVVLNMTEPSALSSSPAEMEFSERLMSVSAVYHMNPKAFKRNVAEETEAMFKDSGFSKTSGQINEMALDFTDLVKDFSGALKTRDQLKNYLVGKGWQPRDAEIFSQNSERFAESMGAPVDHAAAQFMAGFATQPDMLERIQNVYVEGGISQQEAKQFGLAAREVYQTRPEVIPNTVEFGAAMRQSSHLKGMAPEMVQRGTEREILDHVVQTSPRLVDGAAAQFVAAMTMHPDLTTGQVEVGYMAMGISQQEAKQFGLAAREVYQTRPEVIPNTVEFGAAMRQSSHLKGMAPEMVQRGTEFKALTGIMETVARPVDAPTALVSFAVKDDAQAVQGRWEALFGRNSKIGSDLAEAAAREMARVVNANPQGNRAILANALRTNRNLIAMGINEEVVRVLPQALNIALQSRTLSGALPAMLQTSSSQKVTEAIQRVPGLLFDTDRIPVVIKAMQEVAGKNPGAFVGQDLKTTYRDIGLTETEATQLSRQGTVEAIAGEMARQMGDRVDLETAGTAAVWQLNSKVSKEILGSRLKQVPEIGAMAPRIAGLLVDHSGYMVSKQAILEMLNREDHSIGERAINATISERGIQMINLAARAVYEDQARPDKVGGIDINPAFLKLLVKRDGNGIAIPTSKVVLKDTDIYGFEPVISKIEQVDDLPAFIGIEE